MSEPLLIARNASADCFLLPQLANRHGLILVVKSAVRTVGSAIGREIVRGVFGSLLGGGGRRR